MAYKRISPIPIVEGGTNATSMTTTDGVVYFDGTRLVTTAVGSSGQVLTSNGAGMAPTFQTGGSGGGGSLVLIESQTVQLAYFIDFTSGITATYNNYQLVMTNIFISAPPSNSNLIIQLSTNGGSSYISTNYVSGLSGFAIDTAIGSVSIAFISNGTSHLFNLTSGTNYVQFSPPVDGVKYDEASNVSSLAGTIDAYSVANTIVDAIRISTDTSSQITGTFSLYGIAE